MKKHMNMVLVHGVDALERLTTIGGASPSPSSSSNVVTIGAGQNEQKKFFSCAFNANLWW